MIYNGTDFFKKYLTSTVITDGFVFWMNETEDGYFKINVDNGEICEVTAVESTKGKYVRLNDLVSISRAMTNFISAAGSMAEFAMPNQKISHQVIRGIGHKVKSRPANEIDYMLWASHDVYLELASSYAMLEQIFCNPKITHYALKDGRTLQISCVRDNDVKFTILDHSTPVKQNLLKMRNALREYVLYFESII
jgi:hypothetical protein